jgi:hypothetical protein
MTTTRTTTLQHMRVIVIDGCYPYFYVLVLYYPPLQPAGQGLKNGTVLLTDNGLVLFFLAVRQYSSTLCNLYTKTVLN